VASKLGDFKVLITPSYQSIARPNNGERPSKIYVCTAADEKFYKYIKNFIASIHHHNFDDLGEIAIFDLGFTPEQREELSHIEKINVYDIERTNPDILTIFKVRPPHAPEPHKVGRGWYSWKPVVLKQALDMFPYVLYLDSGVTVHRSLIPLFEHIWNEGCFLITCWHSIRWMATQYVIEKLDLKSPERAFLLDENTHGISAGLQGVSRAVYNPYVLPMYELSKDIRCFIDDGTAPDGFGCARHDQTLFSIYVQYLALRVVFPGSQLNDRHRTTYNPFFQVTKNDMNPHELYYLRYKRN
jgi:hypothetical protein